MPPAIDSRGLAKLTAAPSSVTVPASGRCTPVMILISVDFPAPFSPSSAWMLPGASRSDTSSSACTPGNALLAPVMTSLAVMPGPGTG